MTNETTTATTTPETGPSYAELLHIVEDLARVQAPTGVYAPLVKRAREATS